MSVTVRIPTTLRPLAGGSSEVEVDGATVGDVLKALDAKHPGFSDRLLDEEGGMVGFIGQLETESFPYPLFVAELKTSSLGGSEVSTVRPPSRYPSVEADLTLTHSREIPCRSRRPIMSLTSGVAKSCAAADSDSVASRLPNTLPSQPRRVTPTPSLPWIRGTVINLLPWDTPCRLPALS